MTIFISIAAYRDPELAPTITDALRQAKRPGDLRFGVCWQHETGETPPPTLDGGRMRVTPVRWQDSRGACWARAACMQLYDGEDFYLQLDSHHRFAEHWDKTLLDQLERTGAAKPLLTAYLPAYNPDTPTPKTDAPTRMRFDKYTAEGVPLFQFDPIHDWRPDGRPMRARFVSAHMLFAPGGFVAEIPYDPELYFTGEEISLAARAFTHGYDLFHPGVHVAWHEYTRNQRPKHWDDHADASAGGQPWRQLDAASLAKVHRLLNAPAPGPFGLGIARTLADYEAYAGLFFHSQFASRAARQGDEPAPPPSANQLQERHWSIRCAVARTDLPVEALDRPLFWYVGLHDADGIEILRDDAGEPELQRLLAGAGAEIVIERRLTSARAPVSWTIWPIDRQGRWLKRISRPIDPQPAPGLWTAG